MHVRYSGALLVEWILDNDFTRFALIAVVPLLYCVSLVRPFSAHLITKTNHIPNIVFRPSNSPKCHHDDRTHRALP